MDASGCVPWIITLHVLDAVHVVRSWSLSLSKVLWNAQQVWWNTFEIFNCLFGDYGFGEIVVVSLWFQSLGGSIKNSLFSIPESVLCWVKFPVVISRFLLARGKVAVSFSVKGLLISCLIQINTLWENHFFGTIEPLTWNTELHISILRFLWPIVNSFITCTKWLSDMWTIFVFLDIVESISKAFQILSTDDILDVLTGVSFLSIRICFCESFGIISYTPMFLDFTWL